MIPVVSILNLVVAICSLAIGAHVYSSYRETRMRTLLNFSLCYTFLGLFFLLFSVPGVFSSNATVVTVTNIFAYLMLYFGLAYIVRVAFSFLERDSFGFLLYSVSIGAGILFVLFRFLYFQKSVVDDFSWYVYWRPLFPAWLRVSTGIISGLVTLVTIYAFSLYAYRLRNNAFVYHKTLWIITGLSFFVLSSVVSFVLAPKAAFVGSITGTILFMWGLIFMFRGISQHQETPEEHLSRTPDIQK